MNEMLKIKCLSVFSSGTLPTRSLGEIVRKEDLVDSEYLTTLLVLVARCGTPSLLVPRVCLMAFVLFFSFETLTRTRFPSQGKLPAVGEHLRVFVRAGGSAFQQVSSASPDVGKKKSACYTLRGLCSLKVGLNERRGHGQKVHMSAQ